MPFFKFNEGKSLLLDRWEDVVSNIAVGMGYELIDLELVQVVKNEMGKMAPIVEVVSRGDQTWGKMEERAKDVLDQK